MARKIIVTLLTAGVATACAFLVLAQDKAPAKPDQKAPAKPEQKAPAESEQKAPAESERKVKEAEVPAAALAALKKLAGSATITEFAEEVEHGHKYYEGSWKGPEGNVDGLVTEGGDVVEIEESVAADKVPGGPRAAVEKEAGKGATVAWERKTVYFYEAHYKKDGKGHELVFSAEGMPFHEEGGEGKKGGDDDDDDDD